MQFKTLRQPVTTSYQQRCRIYESPQVVASVQHQHTSYSRGSRSSCTFSLTNVQGFIGSRSSRSSMTTNAVRVTGIDHIVLRVNDPVASVEWYHSKLGLEPVRLEEYKEGKVPFPSVRVSPTFLIDLFKKQQQPASGSPPDQAQVTQAQVSSISGTGSPDTNTKINVDHYCLVVDSSDIETVRQQLAAKGVKAEQQFDGVVVKRFGAQGNAQSIYIRDPDQNVVELRTYAAAV